MLQDKRTEIFFSQIFGIALSISTNSRSLYQGNKSDILKRFEKERELKIQGNNSALVVDLLVIGKIIGQQMFRTFKEFATNVFKHFSRPIFWKKLERWHLKKPRNWKPVRIQ